MSARKKSNIDDTNSAINIGSPSLAKSIFEWQRTPWQQLWDAHLAGRLPHGLLFTGLTGTGKTIFADVFANALLCTQTRAEGFPCGECHGCRMLAGNAHPNKITIAPEKPGAAVKIDQVREIAEFTQQTALVGERRIVIIQQANSMNTSAANALLKTLEEPASGALLILISEQDGQLPATIISRCQRILFTRPHQELALKWLSSQIKSDDISPELLLHIAHGAPFKALQLVNGDKLQMRKKLYEALCQAKSINPVKLAAEVEEIELPTLLDYFVGFVMDMMRLKLGAEIAINKDYRLQLTELQSKVDSAEGVSFMQYLQRIRQQTMAGINFNRQLIVEGMLMRWRELMV